MKIAFYVYPIAFQSPGGGEILLLKTKEYLEKQGVSVKFFDQWEDKLSDFDILHTFGSVKDSLRMMEAAKSAGTKNVLSTVCWYNWRSAWGTYPKLSTRLASVARHAAKVALPWLPSQRKEMMQISDALIPNSLSEAKQLENFFLIPKEKISVVYNAVDLSFKEATPNAFEEKYPMRDFILCVGRIEPRKNQLNVIKALKNTDLEIVFIGDAVPGYEDYFNECKKQASSKMHFLGSFPHGSDLLKSAYAACNTFLLATWLETPGLAALEAGLAGAKVVITSEGATQEYFSNYATYVKPHDPSDIREKTLQTYQASKSNNLKEHILKNFTWEKAATETFKIYQDLIKR